MIYNGANHYVDGDPALAPLSYQPGQALFDAEDPASCIARDSEPFLRADAVDAQDGQVSNVCFAQSLVLFEDRWHLYFGMADSRIGCAVAPALRELTDGGEESVNPHLGQVRDDLREGADTAMNTSYRPKVDPPFKWMT